MFFTTSLILLHIKLRKIGLTAYEYIVYKDEREERLDDLMNGRITQEEFDEEEKQAQEDLRKKKKSRIIHQINKENKKAYRERIIERNKKAREEQTKREDEKKEAQKKTPSPKKEKEDKFKAIKEKANENDFDDIMNGDKNPERINKYDSKSNINGRSNKYEDNEEIKVSMDKTKAATNDKTMNQRGLTIKTIKEEEEESSQSKGSRDDELGNDSSLERDGSASERQESDINDRADWKMSDENRTLEKGSSDTNLHKPSNDSPMSVDNKKDTILAKMEKAPPSDLDEASD